MSKLLVTSVVLSMAFGISRLLLPAMPLDISAMSLYKDASHIFVGILLGLCLGAKDFDDRGAYVMQLVILTLIEVVVFFVKSQGV